MFDRINKGMWWDWALTLVEGCTPVSPGCDNCWSAAMASRFNASALYYPDDPQYLPLTTCGKFNGKINCRHDRLDLPLKVKKPTVWAVWNDLFHEDVPFHFQVSALVMMREATNHIFIVLTKRPERMKYFFGLLYRGQFASQEPLFNVWLGVTAENQEQADKRIPILLQIPAAVRFVSVEPMLEPVDLTKLGFLSKNIYPLDSLRGEIIKETANSGILYVENTNKLDWVICGCESGPRRRQTDWSWIRLLADQCKAAGVPFFLKQKELGGKVVKAPYSKHLELPRHD